MHYAGHEEENDHCSDNRLHHRRHHHRHPQCSPHHCPHHHRDSLFRSEYISRTERPPRVGDSQKRGGDKLKERKEVKGEERE